MFINIRISLSNWEGDKKQFRFFKTLEFCQQEDQRQKSSGKRVPRISGFSISSPFPLYWFSFIPLLFRISTCRDPYSPQHTKQSHILPVPLVIINNTLGNYLCYNFYRSQGFLPPDEGMKHGWWRTVVISVGVNRWADILGSNRTFTNPLESSSDCTMNCIVPLSVCKLTYDYLIVVRALTKWIWKPDIAGFPSSRHLKWLWGRGQDMENDFHCQKVQ